MNIIISSVTLTKANRRIFIMRWISSSATLINICLYFVEFMTFKGYQRVMYKNRWLLNLLFALILIWKWIENNEKQTTTTQKKKIRLLTQTSQIRSQHMTKCVGLNMSVRCVEQMSAFCMPKFIIFLPHCLQWFDAYYFQTMTHL